MISDFPKVSIVVATYNYAKKISPTIEGILGTNYPNDSEIIVVNDGSNDNTAEVLAKDFGKNNRI